MRSLTAWPTVVAAQSWRASRLDADPQFVTAAQWFPRLPRRQGRAQAGGAVRQAATLLAQHPTGTNTPARAQRAAIVLPHLFPPGPNVTSRLKLLMSYSVIRSQNVTHA